MAQTVSVEIFTRWRDQARADFEGMGTGVNQRLAHCRVCGGRLEAGSGIKYCELMADLYRGSDRYVCADCEELTRSG